jgi:threonine dehydratase
MAVTLQQIHEAAVALRSISNQTPLLPDERLSQELNAQVFLKAECTQRSGSFKVRGAYNTIRQLTPEERTRGVIAHSAGNHAQGVALAARLHNIPATIVMPEHAPLTKVAATRRYGAEVILAGATFDDAGIHARALQAEHGLTYVHAFDDDRVIAGQGTLGLEVADALPNLNLMVVPIGGGGLISGIALALKALVPNVRIIGVQAAGCAPIPQSLQAGKPVSVASARTIADGIAVKCPGERTLPIIRQLVDEVVTVDDEEIARAIAHTTQHAKLVVEGAGAAGLAALLAGKIRVAPGEVVCTPLCGGNIDGNLLARVIEQVLVRQGRYILIKTLVDDRPGNLAPLLNQVATAGANVVEIFHRRAVWLAPIAQVGLELILEVRDEEHGQSLIQHLNRAGYHVERVGQGRWLD